MIKDERDRFEQLKEKLKKEQGIRSLVQSIALAEKRIFTIIVNKTPLQAQAALEVLELEISEERKKPVRFIRFAFNEEEKSPDKFKAIVSQILEPLYFWKKFDDTDWVFVIDISGATPEDHDE